MTVKILKQEDLDSNPGFMVLFWVNYTVICASISSSVKYK